MKKRQVKSRFFHKYSTFVGGGLLFCIVLLFSGCENFLEGAEIKQRIEEEIAYAKAPKTTIRVSVQNSDYGTVYPTSIYGAAGDSFTLEFTQKQGSIFKFWSCTDSDGYFSDCVTFSDEETEENTADSTTIRKVKVTINEVADGLLITPSCYIQTETVPPILTGAGLCSTDDTQDPLYRELTGKDFGSWDDAESAEYKYGDFSKNHVGSSVFVNVAGHDEQSGVSDVLVKETFYRAVDTSEANSTTGTYHLSKERNFVQNRDGSFSSWYSLKTSSDGVIKLDFTLVDYAGNESEARTFYVIKDTSIDENQVKFEECDALYYSGWGLSLYNKIRKRDGKNDTVTLTLPSVPQDTFYGDYKTDYNVSVKWGTSKEDITNCATKETDGEKTKFVFTHNAYQNVFLQINVSDEFGNTRNLQRAIPSQAVIQSCSKTNSYGSDELNIAAVNKTQNDSLLAYYGADSFFCNFIIRNTAEGDASWYSSGSSVYLFDTSGNSRGHTFYVYMVTGFIYGDEKYLSPLSDDYVEVVVNASSYSIYDSYALKRSSSTGLDDGYIVDYLKVSTEAVLSSGCYRVIFDDEFLDRVTLDTTDITYSLIAKNESGDMIESKDFTFYLPSPTKYEIFLKAENSNNKSVTSASYRYLQINGSENNREQYLEFTADLTPPVFNNTAIHIIESDFPAYYLENGYPEVVSDSGGLITNDKGLSVMDYYLIPNTSSNLMSYDIYTMESLESYSDLKKSIAFESSSASIKIPFDGVEEGFYTICLVAKDAAGNYAIKNRPAYNRRLGKSLPWKLILYSTNYDDIRYRLTAEKYYKLYYYDSAENEWKRTGSVYTDTSNQALGGYKYFCSVGKTDHDDDWVKFVPEFESNDGSTYSSGFYDASYINLGYWKQFIDEDAPKVTCLSKNVMEGLNGLSILCDKSTFAHTLYCSKKLSDGTDESDIALWENKAMETGVMFASTNFTYGKDKYKEIPAGCYYTTIIHFADGTTIMTDVKQK